MRTYLLQRLLLAIPTIALVTFIVFALIQLLPGDVASYIAGPEATEADIQQVRKEYRLDEPIVLQYGAWMVNLFQGDFGDSARLTGIPVRTLLGQRIPATIELTLLATAMSLAISIPAGLLTAARRDTPLDFLVTTGALFGISFPGFVLAYVFIFFFAVEWGILPATGYIPLRDDVFENARHMLLPAAALAAATMAAQTRMLRTTALEVLSQDYVRTARAKGLSSRVVLYRHVLRAALIPFITIAGLQMAHMLSGAVVIETVFAIPGLGSLAVESIRARDFPTLQGAVLVSVVFYLSMTILIDILYAVLDPRIRLGGARG